MATNKLQKSEGGDEAQGGLAKAAFVLQTIAGIVVPYEFLSPATSTLTINVGDDGAKGVLVTSTRTVNLFLGFDGIASDVDAAGTRRSLPPGDAIPQSRFYPFSGDKQPLFIFLKVLAGTGDIFVEVVK